MREGLARIRYEDSSERLREMITYATEAKAKRDGGRGGKDELGAKARRNRAAPIKESRTRIRKERGLNEGYVGTGDRMFEGRWTECPKD